MTKEKPILFSDPMVRALLNTRPNAWPPEPIDPSKPFKWQTRRVVKPRYKPEEIGFEVSRGMAALYILNEEERIVREENPPHMSGDILWVRETWQSLHNMIEEGAASVFADRHFYRANFKPEDIQPTELYAITNWRWRSPLFMPHVAARIKLEVKGVRIERLRDITEDEAKAEGVNGCCANRHCDNPDECAVTDYLDPFMETWDSLNAKRGCGWASNPWVWVYEFMRIT